MDLNEFTKKYFGLFFCSVYLIICVISVNMYGFFLQFVAVPTVFTYIFIKLKNIKKLFITIVVFLLALVFSGAGFLEIIYLFYYILMGIVIFFTLKSAQGIFKKGAFVFLVMLLSTFFLFLALDAVSDGPSFFESLNKIMTDSDLLKEISSVIARNSGRETIDLSTVDTNVLRIIISSLIPVIMVIFVGFISFINFSMISVIMHNDNKFIKRVPDLWVMSFPKALSQIMVSLLILSFFSSTAMGDFGAGLFMSIFALTIIMFMVQGGFLLSHYIYKLKLNPIITVIISVAGFFIASFTSIGSLILINGGFIDLIFNLRKLNGKSVN